MPEELQGTTQGEPVQDQSDVQPTDGQGEGGQAQQQQQDIDYEKAYKNLEPEFTRKSQELSRLKGWAEFEKRTGISAEMALQQLESMGYGQQAITAGTINAGQIPQNPYAGQPVPTAQPQYPVSPNYTDPRLSQMEQELAELRRERQMERLSQKFPQFKEQIGRAHV